MTTTPDTANTPTLNIPAVPGGEPRPVTVPPMTFDQVMAMIAEFIEPTPAPPMPGLTWWASSITEHYAPAEGTPYLLAAPAGPGYYVRGWSTDPHAAPDDIERVVMYLAPVIDPDGVDHTHDVATAMATLLNLVERNAIKRCADASAQACAEASTQAPAEGTTGV